VAKVSDAHLEARRQSILEAAAAVFSRRGVREATMAEVAREAGVSPGAIYRYFEGKDQLVRCCFAASAGSVAEHWRARVRSAADPMAAFAALSEESFAKIAAPGGATDTVFQLEQALDAVRDGEALEDLRGHHQAIIAGLRDGLARAQEAGQLGPRLDPADLALALYATYWGMRLLNLTDPTLDPLRALAQVGLLLEGESGVLSPESQARALTPDP
jgi:AcrR family transcriptional regulator